MRSLTHFLRSSNLNLNSSLRDHEFLASVSLVSCQRRTRKLKKNNTFSAVEELTLLRWHSGTQNRVVRAKQSDQIDNEARLFWKAFVKTKHQSLTNLAFMWLVPGADRVVRHICIRCIDHEFCHHIVKVAVDPLGCRLVDPQTTLTMRWRNSLSITGQTHQNLTSICFLR